jgi:hypothetical protein
MAQYEDLTILEKEALHHYIEYLNRWARTNATTAEDAYQLSVKDFFSDHWDETYRVSYSDLGWYALTVLSAGFGDDGGPANLYIWSNSPNTPVPGAKTGYISYILQEFDTMFSVVYNSQDEAAGKPKDDKDEWKELERLIRWALEHVPSDREGHDISEALRLSGAFAASVQRHLQDA